MLLQYLGQLFTVPVYRPPTLLPKMHEAWSYIINRHVTNISLHYIMILTLSC